MSRRRHVEPNDRRVVEGPYTDSVKDALVRLQTAIANSHCAGVAMIIAYKDGTHDFNIDGDMKPSILCLGGALFTKWAVGSD